MEALETYHKWNNTALTLFNMMKTTEQSPIHHAEGNVYIHTQMVVEEVKKSFGNDSALLYTALLHDIAKPLTTKFEDGDIVSPGHAKLGEPISREILWNDFSFEERERISSLIRFHGLPIWFDQKRNVDEAVIAASLRCSLEELANFADCDFRGRICGDVDEQLFKIETFREKAENLGCFDTPFEFANEWARLSFFKRATHQTANIWEPDGPTFVVMCGMPGSGKNTWVEKNWGGQVIEMDSIRKKLKIKPSDKKAQGLIHQTAKEELRVAMRAKKDVLWNATSLTKLQRAAIIDVALNYGAKIEIVYIDANSELVALRNKERESEKQIPTNVLNSMYRKLEVPDLTECHTLKIIT
jgi:predicted kinase